MLSSTAVAKKLLPSFVGIVVLLLTSFTVMKFAGNIDTAAAQTFCDDNVLHSLTSPNGRWLAELHFSNCQLSVPKRWKSYLHLTDLSSGEVYRSTVVMLGRQDDLQLQWTPAALQVSGVDPEALEQVEQPQGLRVELTQPTI
ncbi:hypothetical protein [Shewanella sp.]|uniref:hypothetical protein n=1 Tax=Shewanella sp. TaxID=50422 RepID=UPI003A98097B